MVAIFEFVFGASYLMASCLPEPFPSDKYVWILRMARYPPKPGVTFQVIAENTLDGRAETSIAEPILVVREEVDDRSTLATGCSGCLDGSGVGDEVAHIHFPLVLITRLSVRKKSAFPAFDGQTTVGREFELDDVLELYLLLERVPKRSNVHTDVAEVNGEIAHDHVRPRGNLGQNIGVLVVEIEVHLLAVIDLARFGAQLAVDRKN